MKITRAWAMPNRWTFQIGPIKQLIDRYTHGEDLDWIDPFCGTSEIAYFSNDLNPAFEHTNSHKSAIEYLGGFYDSSLDGTLGALFDPPYSARQIKDCYEGIGLQFTKQDAQNQWTKEKNEIARIIQPGGICISCGWNSNGMGKKRGFQIIEILLVAHGSAHNDTIVTVERRGL